MELFIKNTKTDDAEAVAQAELAWRFMDEFVDKRSDSDS